MNTHRWEARHPSATGQANLTADQRRTDMHHKPPCHVCNDAMHPEGKNLGAENRFSKEILPEERTQPEEIVPRIAGRLRSRTQLPIL